MFEASNKCFDAKARTTADTKLTHICGKNGGGGGGGDGQMESAENELVESAKVDDESHLRHTATLLLLIVVWPTRPMRSSLQLACLLARLLVTCKLRSLIDAPTWPMIWIKVLLAS